MNYAAAELMTELQAMKMSQQTADTAAQMELSAHLRERKLREEFDQQVQHLSNWASHEQQEVATIRPSAT